MFRFTIRELVLLTLVVAMGVGWWLEHQALTSQLRNANDRWYNLSRSIWESGFGVDPNRKWHLIPRSDQTPEQPGIQKASPDEN